MLKLSPKKKIKLLLKGQLNLSTTTKRQSEEYQCCSKKKKEKSKKEEYQCSASHKSSNTNVKEYLFWTKRKARLYFGHHNGYLDPTV